MRLQGMDPKNFVVAVSGTQLGNQLGNTMSVNVIERLLGRVLPAVGLVKHGSLIDRWEMERLFTISPEQLRNALGTAQSHWTISKDKSFRILDTETWAVLK